MSQSSKKTERRPSKREKKRPAQRRVDFSQSVPRVPRYRPTVGAGLGLDDGRRSSTGVPVLRRDTRLSPYFQQLAKQFLTPINATQTITVSPSSYPALVCARHFHKVFDVSAATYPTGFSAAMYPNLFMPGFISNAASVLIPPGGSGSVAITGKPTWDATGDILTTGAMQLYDSAGDQTVTKFVAIPDGALTSHYGLPCTAGPASTFTVNITNVTRQNKFVPVFNIVYKVGVGNWVALANYALAEGASVDRDLTLPLNANAVAFYVTANAAHPTDWNIKLSFVNAQFTSAAATSLGPGFGAFIIDNDIQYGRVVSMSMLISNTSASLTKGGSINAARVPNSFDPFGNAVGQISDLPQNRRHQGDAEFGAYVNWMPLQFDEYEIDNVNAKRLALADAEYIYASIDSWPVGSSVKIQCDWIVEFNTPNQVYEKVMTPPVSDEFKMLYYHLLCMPAAMCNPSHDSLLRQIVNSGVSAFKGSAGFYEKHKDMLHTIANVLSTMAAV